MTGSFDGDNFDVATGLGDLQSQTEVAQDEINGFQVDDLSNMIGQLPSHPVFEVFDVDNGEVDHNSSNPEPLPVSNQSIDYAVIQQQSAALLHELPAGADLELIWHILGRPATELASALYRSDPNLKLFEMVKNYEAVMHVVHCLNNRVLTRDVILTSLHWSPSTFGRKRTAYEWAKTIAVTNRQVYKSSTYYPCCPVSPDSR
ncbi:hypothetical protein EUX98_g8205 [Antrodiella citrinella]|uniref:Uncharacterized protein n=1 Tax=Antrodiella citrinella TaxID=2447956 RepID=A0A4S4MAE9_9APHY|nr:hypothetical protein EUX98_g8205 [Antrodiella citrinella]